MARLSAAINETLLAGAAAGYAVLAGLSLLQPGHFLVPYMTLAQSAGAVKKTSIPAVGILDKGLHSIITPETARAALQTRQNEA